MTYEVTKTILKQIQALDPMAMFAWGAKDLVALKDGLQFKTSGMVKWKGLVRVEYNYGTDLYDLTFGRIRKLEFITDKEYKEVFVDQLVELIDEQVG